MICWLGLPFFFEAVVVVFLHFPQFRLDFSQNEDHRNKDHDHEAPHPDRNPYHHGFGCGLALGYRATGTHE